MLLTLGSVLFTLASAHEHADPECDFSAIQAWMDSKATESPTPAPPVAPAPIGTVAPTTMAPTTMAPTTMAPTTAVPAPATVEVDWNPDFGTSPAIQQTLDVEPGTELTFVWSGFHNVWQTMATASECDFDGAKEVSTGFAGPAKFTLPSDAVEGDQFHFACRVGSHCNMGQHLTVTVRRANNQRRRLPIDKLAAAADLLDGLANQCKPCVQSCVGSSDTRRLDFGSESLLGCLKGCVSVDCSVLETQEACESQAEHCMWNEGTGVRRRLKAGICESKPVDATTLLKGAKDKIINGTRTEMIVGAVVAFVVALAVIAVILDYFGVVRMSRKPRSEM